MIVSELVLLGAFLLLNAAFFIAPFWMHRRESQWLPYDEWKDAFGLKRRLKLFYARKNADFFRVNFDIACLFASFPLFQYLGLQTWWSIAFAVVVCFGFVYIIYIGVMLYIFRYIPVISSDINFGKVGLVILKWRKWLYLIAVLALIVGLGWAFHWLAISVFVPRLEVLAFLSFANVLFLGLTALGLFHIGTYTYVRYHWRTIFSPVAHFFKNIASARRIHRSLRNVDRFLRTQQVSTAAVLSEQPNVVFICIESYGSVIYRHPELKSVFEERLQKKHAELSGAGWHTATHLSQPPIFAGGSWLSFCSFLFGFRVDNNVLYEYIFNNRSQFQRYVSLLKRLSYEGYTNYLANGLGGYKHRIDWDKIARMYSTDVFIDYDSMKYKGQTTDYLNFSVCVPDQYTINAALDRISHEGRKPYSLFFMSLNSHYPFNSPIQPEADWRALNDANHVFPLSGTEDLSLLERYRYAIEYQLDCYTQLIKNHSDNTIFVLFGDHQPPFITKPALGGETPIHIIARRRDFIQSLQTYGYSNGLTPDFASPSMKHEGFYSMFWKSVSAHFGRPNAPEVEFTPNGLEIWVSNPNGAPNNSDPRSRPGSEDN